MTESNTHPNLAADVAAFHRGCSVEDASRPQIPTAAVRDLRWSLIDEEVNEELRTCMMEGDLVGIADAIADSVYVLVGTALSYGIPFDAVWREVQRSNMSKFVDGKALYREDGKVLKGPGFSPADVASVIEKAITR